jgi:hypothetical protein
MALRLTIGRKHAFLSDNVLDAMQDTIRRQPSIVKICLPMASRTGTLQDRTATLSIGTVQAPHCAIPQPYFAPVRPTFSRIAHKRRGIHFDIDVKRLPIDEKGCHYHSPSLGELPPYNAKSQD